jgi:hypothetical protein
MKQHPNRQPRRAKPVNGGDDYNRDADQEFECKRIDDENLNATCIRLRQALR